MKTIGMLGGLSWVSSLRYYQIINQGIFSAVGGHHSAKIIMNSVNSHELVTLLKNSANWEKNIPEFIIPEVKKIEESGADFVIMCCNTVHKIANEVENNINIPLLHIVDSIADKINQKGYNKIGLIGSKNTMEDEFYKNRLFRNNVKDIITPNESDKNLIINIIYDELVF